MPKVSQAAWFKAKLLDWGLSSSKSKLPQFNAQFFLTHIYNEQDGDWYAYDDEQETCHGFFTLRKKDRTENFHVPKLEKALDWDGVDFKALAMSDYSNVTVVIRVDEAGSESKYPFEVNLIDHEDASPGGTVQKMSESELDAMQKEWAVQLKKENKGKGKAKGKPKSPSTKTAASDEPEQEIPENETATQKKFREKAERNAAQKKKDDAAKAAKLAKKEEEEAKKTSKRPRPRPKPKAKAEAETPAECTDEEAWNAVCEKQDELSIKDDDYVNDAMVDASREVAGVGDEEDFDSEEFTDEQWAQVRDLTIAKLDEYQAPE